MGSLKKEKAKAVSPLGRKPLDRLEDRAFRLDGDLQECALASMGKRERHAGRSKRVRQIRKRRPEYSPTTSRNGSC